MTDDISAGIVLDCFKSERNDRIIDVYSKKQLPSGLAAGGMRIHVKLIKSNKHRIVH